MCGRFMLTIVEDRLDKLLGVDFAVWELISRYNVAPTQPVLAVRQNGGKRESVMLRWGFVPSWAKDVAIGNRMINARSETAHEKPAFKNAFKRRRCLIPADGFYEWRRTEKGGGAKGRQPYLITMADEQPFAMAGLWEHWQDPAGNELETCTILTTAANAMVGELHDRMPVILDPEDYSNWLDTSTEDITTAKALCRPYPAELMMHRPVTTYVNNARHEGPACVKPADVQENDGGKGSNGGQTPMLF